MATIEARKGIIIRIDTELFENGKLADLFIKIKKLAMEYEGTTQRLAMSQTHELLFVEFNDHKKSKKFFKALKESGLSQVG